MKSWLRAGLLGGLIIVGMTIARLFFEIPIHFLPYVDWIIIYPAAGALSTVWSSTSPSPKEGVGMAALSGLVAGGIDLGHTLLISISIMGGSDFFVNYYPRHMIPFLQESMASQFFSTENLPVIFGSSIAYLIISAATAALGGWLYVLREQNGIIFSQKAA